MCFIRPIRNVWSVPLENRRILVVGAGGAAAGILGDLLQPGPAELVLGNRSPERARTLALRFASMGNVSSCALEQIQAHGGPSIS